MSCSFANGDSRILAKDSAILMIASSCLKRYKEEVEGGVEVVIWCFGGRRRL